MPTLKTDAPPMRIKIGGQWIEVEDVNDYGAIPTLVLADGTEWFVARHPQEAGQAARDYWRDLAENDPAEFECMVGKGTLVSWCLGQWAGPGSTQVRSLSEWLDLWLDIPEEQWASYDGNEWDVDASNVTLEDEIGFVPTVAYRSN